MEESNTKEILFTIQLKKEGTMKKMVIIILGNLKIGNLMEKESIIMKMEKL